MMASFIFLLIPTIVLLCKERNAAIDAAFIKSAQSPLLENIVNQKVEMP